jgi:TRAP-type mannitol/chloroaromatic compound transport system substrate-binding protein
VNRAQELTSLSSEESKVVEGDMLFSQPQFSKLNAQHGVILKEYGKMADILLEMRAEFKAKKDLKRLAAVDEAIDKIYEMKEIATKSLQEFNKDYLAAEI